MKFFNVEFEDNKYFEEKLLEIENTQVRIEAEKIVSGILQPFYNEMNKSFQQLEKRMLSKEDKHTELQIITSIKPRSKIDEMDNFLHPMKRGDLVEPFIDTNRILEELNKHKKAYLYFVYAETSYENILEIMKLKPIFHADIETEYGSYRGNICLEPNHGYQEILKKLYDSFIKNGLKWKTVNAPFIYKLFNVMLIDALIPNDENIKSIKIDFGEYQNVLRFDYVPLWNICTRTVMTSIYPKSCLDHLHYEHIVQGSKLHTNCDYIVKSDRQVWNTSRMNEWKDSKLQSVDDLVIECNERKPVRWSLWEFSKMPQNVYTEFSLMENERSNVDRCVRTQAEAICFAQELSVSKYIKLKKVSTEKPNDFIKDTVYDMDDFLPKGIRDKKLSPTLYFECEAMDLPDLWRQDILSYFLCRFQSVFPEYNCVGSIVK